MDPVWMDPIAAVVPPKMTSGHFQSLMYFTIDLWDAEDADIDDVAVVCTIGRMYCLSNSMTNRSLLFKLT